MGIFSAKRKGYRLTFCQEIWIFMVGVFSEKCNGYRLTFAKKSDFAKRANFRQKAKAIGLLLPTNKIFQNGRIFGKEQRL